MFSCQAILFYVPRWLWKNWEAGKISALKMDLDQVRQILRYSNIHTVDLNQIQQIFKHSYKGLGPGSINILIIKCSFNGLE